MVCLSLIKLYDEQERRVNEFIKSCGKGKTKIEEAWCKYLEENNIRFPYAYWNWLKRAVRTINWLMIITCGSVIGE